MFFFIKFVILNTNLINLKKTLDIAIKTNAKRYFSVSSDKAADPVNFMGATKALMEIVLKYYSKYLNTSSARFGNVAFSEGSILDNTKIENFRPCDFFGLKKTHTKIP